MESANIEKAAEEIEMEMKAARGADASEGQVDVSPGALAVCDFPVNGDNRTGQALMYRLTDGGQFIPPRHAQRRPP